MSFLAGLIAIVVLGAAAQFAVLPRADLAYLLYAAASVIDGARLYVDVVEINPPLIILLNMPAVLLARAADLSDILVYRTLVIVGLLATLAFADGWLARILGPDETTLRHRLVLVLAFALYLAPIDDFGQREHLMVALALPYLLLAVGRADGRRAPIGVALPAGVLAGIGLALKPQFLLLWAAIEGYLAWRLRVRPRSYETLGVAAFLVPYTAGVLLLTPEYLRLLRLLGSAYSDYGGYSFLHVLGTAPGAALCALAILAWSALRHEARHRALWTILLLSLVAAFLAGAVQQKGWGYHFYPSRVFAVVLLALAVIDVRRPLVRPVQRVYTAVAFAAVGVVLYSAVATGIGHIADWNPTRAAERNQLAELVTAVRRNIPRGGSLYVLSYTNESGFPLVNYSGVRWGSRFPHLWILEAVYHDQLRTAPRLRFHPAAEMNAAERYLNQAVYEDLVRYRPDLLMVLRHARDIPQNTHRRLDYLAYFSREPRIDSLLRQYRYVETVGEHLLYVRADSPDQPGVLPISKPGEYDLLRSKVAGGRDLVSDTALLLDLLIFAVLGVIGYARAHREVATSAPQAPPVG